MQELMSLSARFGLTVTFLRPDKDRFVHIVTELAERYGVDVPHDELIVRAEAFAIRSGGAARAWHVSSSNCVAPAFCNHRVYEISAPHDAGRIFLQSNRSGHDCALIGAADHLGRSAPASRI